MGRGIPGCCQVIEGWSLDRVLTTTRQNSNTHVGGHGLEMMLLWRQIFVLRCNKDNIIDKYVAEGVNQAPLMKPARNAGA